MLFHLPNLPDPFAPNAMVEVNADMFDPLAMPDPSLVEPMDVQIKTEVIDDEPIAMEGSMITDDPFTHPDAGDVSNLMISSVVSGGISEMDSIETDIEIEPTNLSPNPNSTSSLEIEEHNPIVGRTIPDTDLDGGASADPFGDQNEGTPTGSTSGKKPETESEESASEEENEMEVSRKVSSPPPRPPPKKISMDWINSPPKISCDWAMSPPPPADTNSDSWINSPETATGNGQPEASEASPEENNTNDANLSAEDAVVENGVSNGLNENSNPLSSRSLMDEPGSLGGGDPLGGNEHAATTNNFNDSMDDDSNSNHNNEAINNPQVSNNLSNNLASSQSSHFEHHNGASGNGSGQDDHDPFAGGASGTSFGSNEDFHALLSSNPLENGDTPPPTLLDEDANDLLDQLVGFQTSKELHSTTENSSTSMPF
jgi:hypothetical protein